MAEFKSDFNYQDRVTIDGDDTLIGVVTGFSFRSSGYYTIEISWINNGSSQAVWIEDWRLKLHERKVKQ